MNEATERLMTIVSRIDKSNISYSEFNKLEVLENLKNACESRWKFGVYPMIILVLSLFINWFLFVDSECFIRMPDEASRLFIDPESCTLCDSVLQVDKIANVSPTDLINSYLKKSHPVVVEDGAKEWPAKHYFNFHFFKELFTSVDINRNKDRNCQFFPYQTEFTSLREAFNMTHDRAAMKEGESPWYIGWNNCNDEAGKYLRDFYATPYFFTNLTEQLSLSWVFMGTPGYGAHMHVDNVHYPSWQAQLSGRKLWKLAPPPECHYSCKQVDVVVEPGEIIVLDTNKWYHQTLVLPGEISITIGSEFD